MSDHERPIPGAVQADVAALAGMVERAGADLALAEEPSNFSVALEQGAPDD